MPTSVKTTSNVSSKSFNTQTAAKSVESFTIDSGKIPHSSTNVTAGNVKDALEEVATQMAVGASAPTAAVTEGDVWYDTDDDKFYVRDEDSWNEIFTSISGTVDGGSY